VANLIGGVVGGDKSAGSVFGRPARCRRDVVNSPAPRSQLERIAAAPQRRNPARRCCGLAAKRAARSGASTVIACGSEERVLLRLAAGEAIGTSLIAPETSLGARKQWLADHVQLAGRLTLDPGAVRALAREGKSLLPIGVTAVDGEFGRGEVVGCFDPSGQEIARGLVNYSAQETRRIRRRPSSEIGRSSATPTGGFIH
jgi:glutamate 5-kinase